MLKSTPIKLFVFHFVLFSKSDPLTLTHWHQKPLFQVRAMFSYSPLRRDELSFKEGDIMDVLVTEDEWYQARLADSIGYIPVTYVKPVSFNFNPLYFCLLISPTNQ